MNSASALVLAAAGVGFGHAVLPDHWAPLAVLSRARKDPVQRVVRRSLAAAGTHVVLSLLLGALLIGVGLSFRATVVRYEDYVVGGLLLATGAVFLALELTGRGHGHAHDNGHDHGHEHGHAHDPGHDHGHDDDHAHDHGHARDHAHDSHHGNHNLGNDDRSHRDRSHHDLGRHDHSHHSHPSRGGGRIRAAVALAVPFGAAASPDLTILPVFLAASALGGATAVGALLVFAGVTVATIVGLTVAATLGVARLTAPWMERRANLLTAATLLVFGCLIAAGLV
ncbi:hypothetical protein [Actinospica sp.]|uniref:hypothetical protein n=1 Tax=Actinospica sp. TaxID=1872142 RepID=UPI002C0A4F9C|nr:hypothetical protein [Actinospica sp.]HWG27093.1 hypothetical protein [Actinospica sp.]